MKPYKCPNSKNSFRCKRTKIAEEKNVGERKKHKIRKEYNNSRPGSPTPVQFIQHRDGSVTSLVPILFSISFFSAFSLFFLSCFSLFFSHCFSLSLLIHTEQPATEAPTRIGRLDSSSGHFHVLRLQSHFAPIPTDFHLLVFTIDVESVSAKFSPFRFMTQSRWTKLLSFSSFIFLWLLFFELYSDICCWNRVISIPISKYSEFFLFSF